MQSHHHPLFHPVAVRSFRLWKLKELYELAREYESRCCSSFVPIVETERRAQGDALNTAFTGCSSFVPIVETES